MEEVARTALIRPAGEVAAVPAGSPPRHVPAEAIRGGAPLFVWGVWALSLLAALAFLLAFARNVPFYDELQDMSPVLVGEQPVTARWLWSDHNGHRIPMQRLFLLASYRLTNTDFRAGMYFDVLLMAALAGAMIEVARRVRGRTLYADAFFPLALLHWGNAENLLWNWQVMYYVPVAAAGVVLLLMARRGTRLTPAAAVPAALALVTLCLFGMTGLVYVPVFALWFAWAGLEQVRAPGYAAKLKGLALQGTGAAFLALVGLYLVLYRKNYAGESSASLADALTTAVQFLSGGFGSAGRVFWPLSGAGVVVLSVVSGAVLLVAARRGRPEQRSRAVGLLFFLAACLALALSVGFGRAGQGFAPRYFILAAPALCGVYFVWASCAPPAAGRVVQAGLFALVAVTSALDLRDGWEFGRERRARMEALQADLRAGKSLYEVVGRHGPTLYHYHLGEGATAHPFLEDCLRSLRRGGVGDFGRLRDELPRHRAVALPLEDSVAGKVEGEGEVDAEGIARTYRLYALPRPRFVYGIRLTYWMRPGESDDSYVAVYRKKPGQATFSPAERYVEYTYWGGGATGRRQGERAVTIWVYDEVEQLRIHPDNTPGRFEVSAIDLLVPETGEACPADP